MSAEWLPDDPDESRDSDIEENHPSTILVHFSKLEVREHFEAEIVLSFMYKQ